MRRYPYRFRNNRSSVLHAKPHGCYYMANHCLNSLEFLLFLLPNMKKSKSLYSTYTFGAFLKAVIIKAICIGAIAYLIIHFNENRAVVGIFIALAVLLFTISGTEYIVVYPDRFEIKSDALINISKAKTTFSYQETEGVYGEPAPTTGEIITYTLLRPFTRLGKTEGRKLYIQLKNGKEVLFWIDIYSQDLSKAITMINNQLSKKPA